MKKLILLTIVVFAILGCRRRVMMSSSKYRMSAPHNMKKKHPKYEPNPEDNMDMPDIKFDTSGVEPPLPYVLPEDSTEKKTDENIFIPKH